MSRLKFTDYEPLYYQLFKILKNDIDTNPEMVFVPTEKEIINKYEVSRVTVRKALEMLRNIDYIESSRGKRSKILKNKKRFSINLEELYNDLTIKDIKLVSTHINTGFELPNNKIKNALRLDNKRKVFKLERVRENEGVPVVYSISYLADWLPIDFKNLHITESSSLKKIYENNGIEISSFEETIEAIVPDRKIKKFLRIDDMTGIFYRERISYDNENPFEFVINFYNGKYYKYYLKKGR